VFLAPAGPSLRYEFIVSPFVVKCNSNQYNSLMKLSRLKEHRERRGLTQMELAKLADVGRSTIAAIETGKRPRPHPPTRERLAKALKVKPEDLV
jgi:DNA-binding XRE family transcriptional regulator